MSKLMAKRARRTRARVATFGYAALIERRHWTLAPRPCRCYRRQPSLRVLHISDLHMMPGQRSKQRWVAELAAVKPDLVVNTGDNLAHPKAVPGVLAHWSRSGAARAVRVRQQRLPGADAEEPPALLRPVPPPAAKGRCAALARPARGHARARGVDATTNAAPSTWPASRWPSPASTTRHRRDRYQMIAGPVTEAATLKLGLTHSRNPGCSTSLPPTATT